jgi:acyl-ACP thioesterase
VRNFDIDAYGYVSPARIAGYLQQAASESADALGFGVLDLNQKGQTWVLVRQQWHIETAILLGDEISVETWPSGINRSAALRDFRLLRNGEEIGRAITSWFVLDLLTRRPVRPATVLPRPFHIQLSHVLEPQVETIPAIAEPTGQRHFAVRYSDIDINHHVTNASYVSWALEAVDAATWSDRRLTSLDVQFMAECRLGASVTSRSQRVHADRWLHSIVRDEDQKELARAISTWTDK